MRGRTAAVQGVCSAISRDVVRRALTPLVARGGTRDEDRPESEQRRRGGPREPDGRSTSARCLGPQEYQVPGSHVDARDCNARLSAYLTAHHARFVQPAILTGATLGWVQVPGPPVEASIALSIVFVASEIVHTRQGRYSVTQHYPWVVAFAFGLLHGFGFAGALAQIGLPQSSIPIALLFFNVGVEIGPLLFVGAVLAVIAAGWRARHRLRLSQSACIGRIAPYAIGALASFWLVERIAAF